MKTKKAKLNKRALGNRNKLKAKKWLESEGYYVENCELNKICYFQKKLFAVHKDLMGSDLIAMNQEKNEIVFVQSKTNKNDMQKGVKEFAKYPFPKCVKRWVMRFEPRIKKPIIIKI